MHKKLLGIILMFMAACCSTAVFAETVILKSGKIVDGKITEQTDKYIKVDFEGMSLTYYSDEIESIDGKKPGQAPSPVIKENSPLKAEDIIKNIISSYKGMKTYASEGEIEDSFNVMGTFQKQTKVVSIKLKKPALYKIEWQAKGSTGFADNGVVWDAGEGAYLEQTGQYQKYTSDKLALSAATGVSSGAAFVIPMLFLDTGLNPFEKIEEVKLNGTEMIDGKDCYVISGQTPISTEDKFWVTKDKFLIVQRTYKLDKKPEIPAFTGAQLDEAIKASGLDVNDENREKMKQLMEMSKEALKSSKLLEGATHQENYTNIVTDQDIALQELNNEVPAGAQQNAMSKVFNNLDDMKYSMIAAQGISLTPDEATSLEAVLAKKPDDFETRLKLLGYYFAKQTPEAISKKQGHIIWIVKNKPDYPGGELIWPQLSLVPQIDGDVYDQVKQLWLDQVQKSPQNAVILRNAARYFKVSDAAISKDLFEKAKAIDPKPTLDEK